MKNKQIKQAFQKVVNAQIPDDIDKLAEDITNQFRQDLDKPKIKILWEYIMERKITRYAAAAAVLIIVTFVGASIFNGSANDTEVNYAIAPSTEITETVDTMPVTAMAVDTLQTELAEVDSMFASGDVDGLIGVLSSDRSEARVAAANYLAKIGGFEAVDALEKLSDEFTNDSQQNPFASAIEQIENRLTPATEPVVVETTPLQSPAPMASAEPVAKTPAPIVEPESTQQATDKILLKINLSPGQKFTSKTTIAQKISQTVQGNPMDIENNMTMTTLDEVLAVDANGTASIKSAFESIQVTMITPMGKTEFDSENPSIQDSNNPMAKSIIAVFSAMSECEFVMDVTPVGRIVRIHGFEEMMEKMVEKMEAKPEEAEMMKGMMKQFMNEDKLKDMSNDSFIAFMDEPVSPGDVWYDITSVDMGFPVDMDVTHMLTARKDGIAYIDTISKMDMGDSESNFMEMNGIKMNMQMSGTMSGSAQVDEVTGMILKNKMTQRFSGVMKMAPNPQMPQGMTMPMTIEQTATVESQEIK